MGRSKGHSLPATARGNVDWCEAEPICQILFTLETQPTHPALSTTNCHARFGSGESRRNVLDMREVDTRHRPHCR
jgi:hypothetical protein